MLKGRKEASGRCRVMRGHRGRAEKRISIETPVELRRVQEFGSPEPGLTENACSFGIRVLTRFALRAGDQLIVSLTAPIGKLRTRARVVYCQALPGRRFASGLQFEEAARDVFSLFRGNIGND
jgi:hypothetical protein